MPVNQTSSHNYPQSRSASKLTTVKPQSATMKTAATRPSLSTARPLSKPTPAPRTVSPRPAPKRTLTHRQIYVIGGIVAALLLLMAIVIPLVAVENRHNTVFADEYRSTARHGYSSEIIGTVERNIPTTTQDGGLVANGTIPTYPTYGSNVQYYLADKNKTEEQLRAEETQRKTALIKEAEALSSCYTWNDVSGGHGGSYAYFDKNGYQRTITGDYVDDGQGGHAQLYAHTAAKSMYFQGVHHVPYISNEEPAVVKRMTFQPRSSGNKGSRGYSVTGLYAAPGELVTVKVSGADLTAAGGELTFHIGQCLYNGQSNNIWAQKNINRMPIILNTLKVNKNTAEYDQKNDIYTAYLGSYLGGPIYLRATSKPVTVVLAGALEYRHFVLGYTTEKEYERLCRTTTPYFDLEVWDNGILHSGSVYYAAQYSYDEIFNAAVLWEKITLVSSQVYQQGVVMIYDPFVAAGAAVAFPGRSSTNCPSSWMGGALNAASFEKAGAWGTMHEYNHNFQGGWELPGGGEVSNNALNLASYLAFTKISSARRLSSLNSDTGLGGWNAYTNASWALKNTLYNLDNSNQLVIYATLLHNIGPKNFINGVAHRYNGGANALYREMSVATGYNYDYFFKKILQDGLGEILNVTPTVSANEGLPAFVPISTIYQTGRSVLTAQGTTELIQTMQPYEFAYGENLTLDLRRYDGGQNGTIVLPNGITFDLVNMTQPEFGSLQATNTAGVYTYVPDPKHLSSGQIKVTVKLHADANVVDSAYVAAIEGQTVDLILELKQSHDMKRTMLQRTVYQYNSSGATDPLQTLYGNDPIQAFTSNFAGHTATATADNINPVENSNTDIWLSQDDYNRYGANSILVVSGKIYVPEAGEYRLTLRGRVNAGVVISLDGGNNYDRFIKITNQGGSATLTATADNSLDLPNLTAGQWIYFQEILFLNQKANGNKIPFIGLGWGKVERNAVLVERTDDDGNKTYEFEETVQATLNYAAGYRTTYEFATETFHSAYLFQRDWHSTYDPSVKYDNRGTLITVKNYVPWDDNYSIDNLFDADPNNAINNKKGAAYDITPAHPFELIVDLGANQTVNTMTIYGRGSRFINYLPRNFTLYGGCQPDQMQILVTHTATDDDWRVGNDLVVKFKPVSIRYYYLVVEDTYAYNNPAGTRYISFRYLQFDGILDVLTNGTHLIPDNAALTYRGTWKAVNAPSTFGRVYCGKAKDKLEFEFTGTRFGIYTAINQANGDFDVYIDGKKVDIAHPQDGKALNDYTAMGYLSAPLKDGKHRVKLVGRANFNVDSVIYW